MAEEFDQTLYETWGKKKKGVVKMTRLMLECGHYVDEQSFRSGCYSARVRCHVCQSSGVLKSDIA